jgi:hypothetical protein
LKAPSRGAILVKMTLRLAGLSAVLLASAALGRPAFADDAQAAAAAAAAQAVGGMATGGAAGAPGVAGAGAAKSSGPGAGGHFSRQLSAPSIQRVNGRAKGATAKKKAKGARIPASKMRPDESKYKSRELVENSEHSYRFDENGNPKSAAAAPKKLSSKSAKKTSSADASDDKDEKPGACSTDEPCTVKNSDADAL